MGMAEGKLTLTFRGIDIMQASAYSLLLYLSQSFFFFFKKRQIKLCRMKFGIYRYKWVFPSPHPLLTISPYLARDQHPSPALVENAAAAAFLLPKCRGRVHSARKDDPCVSACGVLIEASFCLSREREKEKKRDPVECLSCLLCGCGSGGWVLGEQLLRGKWQLIWRCESWENECVGRGGGGIELEILSNAHGQSVRLFLHVIFLFKSTPLTLNSTRVCGYVLI